MKYFFLFTLLFSFGKTGAQETTLAATASELRAAVKEFETIRNQENNQEKAKAAQKIATIYRREKLSTKAIEYYQIALQNIEEEEELLKIDLLNGLAQAFSEEQEMDSVLHYHQVLFHIFQKNQDYEKQLERLQKIARIQEKQMDFSQAIITYQSIIVLAQTNSDQAEVAVAHNNIGYLQNHEKDFIAAIKHLRLAEELDAAQPSINRITLYTNLAIAHLNDEQTATALDYLSLAKKAAKEKPLQAAQIAHLTARIYLQEKDFYNAQQYNNEAILGAQESADANLLSQAYATSASIHQGLYEYEDALSFYEKHLNIRDSLLLEEKIREQSLLQMQFLLEKTEKEMRLLLVNESMNELTIQQLELERNNLKLASDKYELEAAQQEASLSILQKEKAIREAAFQNKELAALQAQQQLRLTQQQLEAEQKDRNIADLKQRESLQELQLQQQAALEKERLQEIELLNQQQAISDLELTQQATFRKAAYITGLLMSLILLLVIASYLFSRRTNRRLAAQKAEIEKSRIETEIEKAKSDTLLLNILPSETAKELKDTGFATPRQYDQVSVLFTDFVNFTNFAENISAEDLIEELNACFIAFDEIIEAHGLEKIKTIGDAYMCAGGIPVANQTNALDAVKAGLAMQQFMRLRGQKQAAANLPFCKMRLGIHTGPVIAGVVGKKKFAYDIWGDTVNLASRMESSGETGQVNISEATYALVKEKYTCEFRGELAAKNKGKVGMYFVRS